MFAFSSLSAKCICSKLYEKAKNRFRFFLTLKVSELLKCRSNFDCNDDFRGKIFEILS